MKATQPQASLNLHDVKDIYSNYTEAVYFIASALTFITYLALSTIAPPLLSASISALLILSLVLAPKRLFRVYWLKVTETSLLIKGGLNMISISKEHVRQVLYFGPDGEEYHIQIHLNSERSLDEYEATGLTINYDERYVQLTVADSSLFATHSVVS